MSQAEEDQVLIRQCQKGDRSAFDALVRRYEQRTYQYAFRLTRDPEEAADVVGDAFVRVFNALKNFRGQSSFSTWLYRIVTNCFLDRRKKDRDRVVVSLDAPIGSEGSEATRQIEDKGDGPVEHAERGARETAVSQALDGMADFQKAMLIMFHVENLTYEEISEALDLPLGTVKSRLNRARIALRDQLAQSSELFLSI